MTGRAESADLAALVRAKLDAAINRDGPVILSWQDCRSILDAISSERWRAERRVIEAARKFMTSGVGKNGEGVAPWCTRSHAELADALAALPASAQPQKGKPE